MNAFKTGIALAANAAIVAAAVAALPLPASAAKPKAEVVHCYGINSCKGSSDCATATNSCKGQNSCKGTGFKALTKKQCAKAGGTLTPPA